MRESQFIALTAANMPGRKAGSLKPDSRADSIKENKRPLSKEQQEVVNRKYLRAADAGDLERVKQLLAEGAEVNCLDTQYGDNSLHSAAFSGDLPTVQYLVETCNMDVSSRNLAAGMYRRTPNRN